MSNTIDDKQTVQSLSVQKMRDLANDINKQNEDNATVKDIIKINNMELGSMLKLEEVYMVKMENNQNETIYLLYTDKGPIGISNNEGVIELDKNYVDNMNEIFEKYGEEYKITSESRKIDPKILEEQADASQKLSELEENEKQPESSQQQKDSKTKKVDKQKDKNIKPEEIVNQMESDLECDILSCTKIEDEENFSKNIIGYDTMHEERYIAYSKSRNTFIFVGKKNGKYEEIEDLCQAESGGKAVESSYIKYNEQGHAIEKKAPSFVMERRDGKDGALAINVKYGAISLDYLTQDEENPGKYKSKEIYIGESIKPTQEELEKEKLEKEKTKGKKLRSSEEQDSDDNYDWSEGRPVPKH